MHYLGNKSFMLKRLIPILCNKSLDRPFVDLFCGSASVVASMPHKIRIANDLNSDLIEMYKALVNDYNFPDWVSKAQYIEMKNNQENFKPCLRAFVGIACSFSGKYFDSFAKNNLNANYAQRGRSSLMKIKGKLKTVKFISKDYTKVVLPKNAVVYCDPPYESVTDGYQQDGFNSEKF